MPLDLPTPKNTLRELIVPESLELCQELLRVKDEENRELHLLVAKLVHEMQLLKRCLYGSRRERFVHDPGQPLLTGFASQLESIASSDTDEVPEAIVEADEEEASEPSRRKSRHQGRRPFPEFMPRKRELVPLSEDQLPCPSCQTPRTQFSEKVTSQVEYIAASLFVREIVRPVYGCPCCDQKHIVTAPLPPQPIDRCVAGPGLLAHVAVSKYADHIPLNREEDILARAGWPVPRSTLCDWMAGVACCLEILWEVMRRRLQECRVIGLDDTYVDLWQKDRRTTKQTRFWIAHGDLTVPYVMVAFHETRTRAGPDQLLTTFEGVLQGDAYSVHQQIVKSAAGRIIYAGCWSHARRNFEQLPPIESRSGHPVLALIRMLYDIEDRAADLSVDARLALRQQESKPIMQQLYAYIEKERITALPRSAYGEALGYVWNQWSTLQVYLDHGTVRMDNNRTEESLRPMTRGRDAWLFLGSPRGGETAATIYTFTATCRRLMLNPQTYLREVLQSIPQILDKHGLEVGCDLATLEAQAPEAVTSLEELLPDVWLAAHSEDRLTHRDAERAKSSDRRKARRNLRRQLPAQ